MVDIQANVPQYVRAVMAALARAGHRGYLVGGSLRDLLRGTSPHDFDLTTDATPDEMQACLGEFRVIPTGIAHGTVTVLSEGNPIEITTHRADGEYLDARHPASVSFTRQLHEDLSRRDFTVNAMAWSEGVGLVDLFGGQADLAAGIIRAVGEPTKRFGEDALRILRAFRFSAQLDFAIEPQTAAGARACREGLSRISVERILSELCRLLSAPAAARGLAALLDADCGPYIFGDAKINTASLSFLEKLPPQAEVRLAALLFDEEPERVRALCRRLHASNALTDGVAGILEAVKAPLPTDLFEARRFAVRYFSVLEQALALHGASGRDIAAAAALLRTVVRDKTAVELRRLAVNGRELQERLALPPQRTGEMLARLQELVWQEPSRNTKATLLALAAELLSKENNENE